MSELVARARLTAPARPALGGLLIIERNVMVYRRTWMILFSGFFEPLFYLFFFVYPLQEFIGDVTFEGETIEYAAFVAPALLASSAMNGAFYDATNVFWKLRYGKVYDSILATPIGPKDVAVGETIWAVVRAMLYSTAYLLVIAAARARRVAVGDPRAAGLLRHRLRLRRSRHRGRHVDADVEGLRPDPAVMLPMFMFSATFYPISVYPEVARVDRPLPAAVPRDRAVRSLTTGTVGPFQLVNVAYLLTMGLIGLYLSSRRIDKLLLK